MKLPLFLVEDGLQEGLGGIRGYRDYALIV